MITSIKLNQVQLFGLLCIFALPIHGGASGSKSLTGKECPVFFKGPQTCDPIAPRSFLPAAMSKKMSTVGTAREPDLDVLTEVLESIDVMQKEYFAAWLGTWPESIDWTGAVMGTHVSGSLRTFSESLLLMKSNVGGGVEDWKVKENLIEDYFSQVVAYYFGEDAFAIRNEAYDDILWVVLGWIEAIKFINTHTSLHYKLQAQHGTAETETINGGMGDMLGNRTWHGNLWTSAFSHRAHIFWDLATHGWDTELCGGGMNWNPRLQPYKNAITNELFIAASISMYLHFPGDDNASPFFKNRDTMNPEDPDITNYLGPRDPKFLKAAMDGYKWLVGSNMTDSQGLFTDGFHISGYNDPTNNNTLCDQRNNMVISYNQGVILTGQRGLFEATGASSYLTEGHQLIQNVINASGYDLVHDQPVEDLSSLATDALPTWYGLGRGGIMEDRCDASGTCSQDGQTFKGIFFHHLVAFCEALAMPPPDSVINVTTRAFEAITSYHAEACKSYSGWLKLNAKAAVGTRDADGKFGVWWTAGLLTSNFTGAWPTMADDGVDRQDSGVDYRNYGVPFDTDWQLASGIVMDPKPKLPTGVPVVVDSEVKQKPISKPREHLPMGELRKREDASKDPNRRGRGRTIETQGSGLALMRAYWKIAQAP
ncbi:uncharacterized protein BCR38DRAFT_356796 [Pseudomassariella vexata]|uniref:Glycosyl hydrolase n=1 Tax=Pseudomassariella vexata TaxID=1141098 RepID=A0A1Y2D884_9PEZI|nr:uncharacterized protein BCR38DRAFT_356796 [Pseudomassariella vexata]ORY55471.1 hypothetical protein BCR38DRAFT_356796 [Pseudomassariella vexata]